MGKLIAQCPSCHHTKLQVVKIKCEECHTLFEGNFEIPAMLTLSPDDLQFIFDFVKCSGSLKEMATKQGVSYPTLRNRLNTLIDVIEKLDAKKENARVEILQSLEEGKISVKDAISLLQKLSGEFK